MLKVEVFGISGKISQRFKDVSAVARQPTTHTPRSDYSGGGTILILLSPEVFMQSSTSLMVKMLSLEM